ncbi:DUF4331 family protein [Enhygromyxa salina]|uniref:Uncharacterized protein n=1 Tax=Enhygromyxa salina TaxID=215803 RepID=A0A2S9Y0E9_9BACT|nr:DUF4331 family protein [Enhygromyxa salina]PRP98569.1 hypothetical protein ENSA7_65120 [Enhygromyxa salina]
MSIYGYAKFLGVILLIVPACSTEDPVPEDPYVFAEDAASEYTRVDRTGMPAIGAVVIMDRQAYNDADPSDDADGVFVEQITGSITALHDALDDDLDGLGLTPCAPEVCVAQAAPLVVPDTIKLDLSAPAGFPNGRLLTDPVIDVTLSVVLLDLSVAGQSVTSLVGVNPPANDVAFETAFPYLAPYYSG